MWNWFLESDFYHALPLLVMWVTLQMTIVLDAVTKSKRHLLFFYSCVGLALTAIAAVVTAPATPVTLFQGMLVVSGYSAFFDVLFALAGILTLFAAHSYLQRVDYELDEFYLLSMYAISGMMMIAHSNHLLMLFIGIEVMSVTFYILAAYLRTRISSVESGLKYFLLGSFSTGFLVYGIALIYGATGSMSYPEIAANAASIEFPMLMLAGIALMIVGLSFKVAAFPFHVWVPDVYQGAPTVVTAFMSTAGKAAAFAAFIPVISALMPGNEEKIIGALAIISSASMLYGNIAAVRQANVKRMLAYSSIAHAGYILIGLVANSAEAFSGMLYYLAAYTFMQIGAMVVLSLIENEHGDNLTLTDLVGLGKRRPVMAAFLSLFMIAMTGIPPLAGFLGKYYLFTAAIDKGFVWLTIVGVVASVISVYFYLGTIVAMYFTKPETPVVEEGASVRSVGFAAVTLFLSAAGIIALGLMPGMITDVTSRLF